MVIVNVKKPCTRIETPLKNIRQFLARDENPFLQKKSENASSVSHEQADERHLISDLLMDTE